MLQMFPYLMTLYHLALALALILAVAATLVVALTLTPILTIMVNVPNLVTNVPGTNVPILSQMCPIVQVTKVSMSLSPVCVCVCVCVVVYVTYRE